MGLLVWVIVRLRWPSDLLCGSASLTMTTRPFRRRSRSAMQHCAVNNTVLGTVASASFASALSRFATAARNAGGFPCTVVSAFDHFDALTSNPLLHALPQPHPPLLPSSLWCNESACPRTTDGACYWVQPRAPDMYGWRRSQLYRVRLWRYVLHHGFDLLAIDLDWTMLYSPLPGIWTAVSPRASSGLTVDVVALWDDNRLNKGGYLNVGNMWIRSTRSTRALSVVVENRSWVAWEQQVGLIARPQELFHSVADGPPSPWHSRGSRTAARSGACTAPPILRPSVPPALCPCAARQVFNEELNFNPAFASITCCQISCMSDASRKRSTGSKDLPDKDAAGRERRIAAEGADSCDGPRSLGAQRPPQRSPEPYASVWRADEFNPEVKPSPHRPAGRCNHESNECLHWGGSGAAGCRTTAVANDITPAQSERLNQPQPASLAQPQPARFELKQPPNSQPSDGHVLAMMRKAEVVRRVSLSRWPTVDAAAGAVKARLCPNGWGDRVLSMLAFATLRHLNGASRLLLYWPENERLGSAFTAVNQYALVSRHFVLAEGISITTNWTAFQRSPGFWFAHDGPLSQDLFPRELSRRFNRSLDEVTRAYAHAQRTLLRPSADIEAILAHQLPAAFTGVHLRRGDKMGVGTAGFEKNDRYALAPTQWHELSARTWQAIPAEGPVVLCSDDDDERRALVARLAGRVVELRTEYTDIADTTFIDFFALSRARTIVLSQRWSAFSFTACLVSHHQRCDYQIAFPHPTQLQAAHRAGFDAVLRPRLMHIVGCHANAKGSRLPLPKHWLAGFQASGAILTNACEGVRWPGHPPTDYHPHPTLVKPRAVQQLVQRLVADGDAESVIMFVEDDMLINFDRADQLSAQTILARYDAVRDDRDIVFGVEPSCWLSRSCTGEEIAQLYPGATSGYSRCPAFVNVGMYIGQARPLLELLNGTCRRRQTR